MPRRSSAATQIGEPARRYARGTPDAQERTNERQRMTTATLSAIEKAGIEAALDRCRALARQIRGDLRNKRPEHFVSIWSWADFQVSLERAASVLEQKSGRSLRIRGRRVVK